jgi:hypothetical protein
MPEERSQPDPQQALIRRRGPRRTVEHVELGTLQYVWWNSAR